MSGVPESIVDLELLQPRRPLELPIRVLCAIGLFTLLFVIWAPFLESVGTWTAQELRVLPRVTMFISILLAGLVLQGAQAPGGRLLLPGLLLLAFNFWIVNYSNLIEFNSFQAARSMSRNMNVLAQTNQYSAEPGSMGYEILMAGPVLQWLALISALLGGILVGIWLGRDLTSPQHFLMLIVCAAAGDIWLSRLHVPESDSSGVLQFLRVAWPSRLTAQTILPINPSLLDIAVVSAITESARLLRFPRIPLLLGALAGYAGAAFLALQPWPGRPELGMLMCGSGVLVACWPELKCGLRDALKAALLGLLLLACLVLLTLLHRRFNPPATPRSEPGRFQGVTMITPEMHTPHETARAARHASQSV